MKKTNRKSNNVKSNSSIKYQGDVTLELKVGDKTVKKVQNHNAGTITLFSLMARALIGETIRTEVPKYIMIYNKLTDTPTELAKTLIPYSTQPITYIKDNSAVIQYVFHIPYQLYKSTLLSVNYIKLFNKNDTSSNYCAEIELENALTLEDNEDLIITWLMIINNGSEIDTE